jgi:hypothetical protein
MCLRQAASPVLSGRRRRVAALACVRGALSSTLEQCRHSAAQCTCAPYVAVCAASDRPWGRRLYTKPGRRTRQFQCGSKHACSARLICDKVNMASALVMLAGWSPPWCPALVAIEIDRSGTGAVHSKSSYSMGFYLKRVARGAKLVLDLEGRGVGRAPANGGRRE